MGSLWIAFRLYFLFFWTSGMFGMYRHLYVYGKFFEQPYKLGSGSVTEKEPLLFFDAGEYANIVLRS